MLQLVKYTLSRGRPLRGLNVQTGHLGLHVHRVLGHGLFQRVRQRGLSRLLGGLRLQRL